MAEFQVGPPLLGGVLIGVAATLTLWFHGRVAGISGIVGELLKPWHREHAWRLFFVLGLLLGGVALRFAYPSALAFSTGKGMGVMVVAGLLVGFGSRLGNGCTSGHGVCGLPQLRLRSLVAVITFMTTGVLTATAMALWAGGQS